MHLSVPRVRPSTASNKMAEEKERTVPRSREMTTREKAKTKREFA